MGIFDGIKVLEEKESKFNGKVTVIKSFAWGTYIQVDGLTQSGGVVKDVWKSTLKRIRKSQLAIRNCLILGLGGGTVAQLVKKYWPEVKITGVDIDPVIVEMGNKYLGLNKLNIDIKIEDANKFLIQSSKVKNQKDNSKFKSKYDLIVVDMYKGYEVPEKFLDEKFMHIIEKLLLKNSIAVFNRLYFGEKRKIAMKFGEKLQKIFPKVDYFFPEANLMFICTN